MEELTTTDAIRREILDDARRKAERALKEADEEAARIARARTEAAERAAGEMLAAEAARVERARSEALARIPLERTRIKTAFVDACLRKAMGDFFARLGEERIAALCGDLLARGAASLAGADFALRRKGLGPERAAGIAALALPGARLAGQAEDPGLPAAGLVAEAADGSVVARATLDILAESLLDASRGELALALCGEALRL